MRTVIAFAFAFTACACKQPAEECGNSPTVAVRGIPTAVVRGPVTVIGTTTTSGPAVRAVHIGPEAANSTVGAFERFEATLDGTALAALARENCNSDNPWSEPECLVALDIRVVDRCGTHEAGQVRLRVDPSPEAVLATLTVVLEDTAPTTTPHLGRILANAAAAGARIELSGSNNLTLPESVVLVQDGDGAAASFEITATDAGPASVTATAGGLQAIDTTTAFGPPRLFPAAGSISSGQTLSVRIEAADTPTCTFSEVPHAAWSTSQVESTLSISRGSTFANSASVLVRCTDSFGQLSTATYTQAGHGEVIDLRIAPTETPVAVGDPLYLQLSAADAVGAQVQVTVEAIGEEGAATLDTTLGSHAAPTALAVSTSTAGTFLAVVRVGESIASTSFQVAAVPTLQPNTASLNLDGPLQVALLSEGSIESCSVSGTRVELTAAGGPIEDVVDAVAAVLHLVVSNGPPVTEQVVCVDRVGQEVVGTYTLDAGRVESLEIAVEVIGGETLPLTGQPVGFVRVSGSLDSAGNTVDLTATNGTVSASVTLFPEADRAVGVVSIVPATAGAVTVTATAGANVVSTHIDAAGPPSFFAPEPTVAPGGSVAIWVEPTPDMVSCSVDPAIGVSVTDSQGREHVGEAVAPETTDPFPLWVSVAAAVENGSQVRVRCRDIWAQEGQLTLEVSGP